MPLAELPQSNKQHAVPQNIMDVEFKLIGDLTMRQFAYLLIFGLIAYLSATFVIGIFKWPFAAISGMLGLGFAFIPIEERGMDDWIVSFFRAIFSPTELVWKKEKFVPSAFLYDNITMVQQEMITLAPTASRRKLEKYLNTYQGTIAVVDPLDFDASRFISKLQNTYQSVQVGVVDVETAQYPDQTFVEEPVYEEFDNEEQPTNETNEQDTSDVSEGVVEPIVPVEDSSITPTTSTTTTLDTPVVTSDVKTDNVVSTTPSTEVKEEAPTHKIIKSNVLHKAVSTFSGKKKQLELPRGGTNVHLEPITPDRHSGRKFTNLLPSSGELILPIRGERVLRTSDQLEIEDDVMEKTAKLQELLKKIQETEKDIVINTPMKIEQKDGVVSVSKEKLEVSDQAEAIVENLKTKNSELNREISTLKEMLDQSGDNAENTEHQDLLARLETERTANAEHYAQLTKQIQELKDNTGEKTVLEKLPDPDVPVVDAASVKADSPSIANKPNIISGMVKGANGAPMSNTLLIVKNSRNEPVRAFKTNVLGDFILTSPLQDGTYTLEVSALGNNQGLTFDKITVELKGDIVPPLEIVSK